MKITSAHIHKYKPFKFSEIRTLDMTLVSDTQIILGDNGCGKSSLLEELCPLPSNKSNYDKDGKKSITIEHNGSEYILTSNFGIKNGVHSFIKDNVELNLSGTTGVQEELIRNHLGYTPLIHDIIHLKYPMCEMTKSDRKNLLLTINPIDLSFILEKHKKVCSKIRECKNNLTLLHKRKSEIEIKLLNKDLLKIKYDDKKILIDQISDLTSYTFALKQYVDRLECEHGELLEEYKPNVDIPRILNFCKKLNVFLYDCRSINRDDPDDELFKLSLKEQQYITQIEQLISTANELVREIDNYSDHLSKATNESNLTDIENKITEYKNLINEIIIPNGITILPELEIDIVQKIINIISSDVLQFVDKTVNKIYDVFIVEKIKNKQRDLLTRKSNIIRNINEYTFKLDSVNKQLSSIPVVNDILEDCKNCDFKKEYNSRFNEYKFQQLEYKKLINDKTKYIEKLDNVINTLTEQLNNQNYYHELVTRIFSQLFKCSTKHIWNYNELIDILNKNPTAVIRHLNDVIQYSKSFYKKRILVEKLDELTHKFNALTSTNIPSLKFLTDTINEKKDRLQTINNDLNIIENDKVELKSTINRYQIFIKSRNKLNELKQDLDKYEKFSVINNTIKYCNEFIYECDKLKYELLDKLKDIELVLKEQESLLSRYDDEILILIKDIEEQKSKYEEIEKALSPSSGFPHKYMMDYINTLITNVNYVVSQIWSYDLQMVPLNIEEPIDFIFPIKVGDQLVSDISKCSKGQKAMLNLAWILAFIIQGKLTDYPIYLDECDEGLDPYHKQKLLEWLKSITDQKYISQMFLINHHAILFEGFSDADVLVLREENIVVPESKNKNVRIS